MHCELLEVLFQVFPIDIARDTGGKDDEDGADAEHPDEEGGDDRNPDIVTVYLCALCHPEDGNRDERYDGRTNAPEEVLHPGVLAELLEDKCDG